MLEFSRNKKQGKQVITINKPLWYSQALAISLVKYARKNPDFARELRRLIHELPKTVDIETTKAGRNLQLLDPFDHTIAVRRAQWLLERIAENNLPGTKQAAGILTSWVGDSPLENPKQILIGITIGRIPGVTLGRLTKRVSMSIIIHEDLAGRIKLDLARDIARASHGVLVSALEMVNGNVNRLEPDLADWFFGEREIAFYTASNLKITAIEKDLKNLGIIHTTQEYEGKSAILAISPVLNSNYGEVFWELERIDV